ncbi:MAG: zinc-ribbon domain-containing protein [Celeribacter sp.]|jgi:predicted Zn finger-like uncharacterized protein
MRLICPNCEAQYAVGDDLIPPGGRDVQCSNCGRTWFQYPEGEGPEPESSAEAIAEPSTDQPPVSQTEPEPRHDPVDGPASSRIKVSRGVRPRKVAPSVPDALPGSADEEHGDWKDIPHDGDADAARDTEAEDAASTDAEAPSEQAVTPPRRRLDASLLQVLREEAEREQAARRRDAGGLEMQPDLGVSEPERARPTPAPTDHTPMVNDEGAGEEDTDDALSVARPEAVPEPVRPVSPDSPEVDAPPQQRDVEPDRMPPAEAAIIAGSAAAAARGDRPESDAVSHPDATSAPTALHDKDRPSVASRAPAGPDDAFETTAGDAQATDSDADMFRDKRGSRRDLLPDIEEINSTLRASGQNAAKETQDPRVARAVRQRRQKGFRLGFGIALIAAGLALFAYSRAPMIAGWIPQAEAPLVAYVNAVNDGRVWLDDRLRQMVGPK